MFSRFIGGTTRFFAAVVLAVSPTMASEPTLRDDSRVVLELFTSQGCPNSPKADALLAELAERDDVIALAYHVDYWDYAGWRDTFGDASYSSRQREYSALRGSNRLYTPQLIVNGSSEAVGSDAAKAAAAMETPALPVDVDLTEADGVLTIDIASGPNYPSSVVWLVTYLNRATVTIEGGENAGQTLSYTNVVTGRRALAAWEPEVGAHLKLPLSELLKGRNNGAAIILQVDTGGYPGPILGAASYEILPDGEQASMK